MIIYIHGFGSSGHGGKATLFKEYFKENILLPSLSYVPQLAIHTLEQLIEMLQKNNEKVHLVGSSLGGFYALHLANKYDLKAVLINPAIYPFQTLDKIGMARNYYDDSTFEVLPKHLDALRALQTQHICQQKNFMTLLQTHDEVLDYKHAVEKLPESKLIIEEGGNHTFEGIQRHFHAIESFFD
jgi:predicted esterase YcpF (UPF0227 family)